MSPGISALHGEIEIELPIVITLLIKGRVGDMQNMKVFPAAFFS